MARSQAGDPRAPEHLDCNGWWARRQSPSGAHQAKRSKGPGAVRKGRNPPSAENLEPAKTPLLRNHGHQVRRRGIAVRIL